MILRFLFFFLPTSNIVYTELFMRIINMYNEQYVAYVEVNTKTLEDKSLDKKHCHKSHLKINRITTLFLHIHIQKNERKHTENTFEFICHEF